MKTALVRILTVATLASSILAFAADNPKSNDTTTVAANTQQEGCATGQKEKKQKKAKSQRDDRTEQEKEFDRTLMGYFG
jgi:type IV secretory pathway VirB6-like protein